MARFIAFWGITFALVKAVEVPTRPNYANECEYALLSSVSPKLPQQSIDKFCKKDKLVDVGAFRIERPVHGWQFHPLKHPKGFDYCFPARGMQLLIADAYTRSDFFALTFSALPTDIRALPEASTGTCPSFATSIVCL